jgi:hypothetical protein
MSTLTVSQETFLHMLSGLIASGVIFEAKEVKSDILITFKGGF